MVLRIACAQFVAEAGDIPANMTRIDEMASEASNGGAKIVVFPELITTGYLSPEAPAPVGAVPPPASALCCGSGKPGAVIALRYSMSTGVS